jgi:hypothetical protein
VLAEVAGQRFVGALAGVLVASFGVITFLRASLWSDEAGLWIAARNETTDDPSLSCVELGRVYSRAGLLTEALVIESKGSNPQFDGYAVAVNNAAAVLARAGHYSDAVRLLAPLAHSYPRVPLFALNVAVFESYRGHFDRARSRVARALALYPGFQRAQAFARALPAMEDARRFLDTLPEQTPAIDRARLLAQLGLAAESITAWRAAVGTGTVSEGEFEEGLWFVLREGDADTVSTMCNEYRSRFKAERDPHLDLACATRAETVKRLRAAWQTIRP